MPQHRGLLLEETPAVAGEEDEVQGPCRPLEPQARGEKLVEVDRAVSAQIHDLEQAAHFRHVHVDGPEELLHGCTVEVIVDLFEANGTRGIQVEALEELSS